MWVSVVCHNEKDNRESSSSGVMGFASNLGGAGGGAKWNPPVFAMVEDGNLHNVSA
jgi:hypothetical protein